MTYDFKLSCTLPASPGAVYDAWLGSAAHTAMTGGEAKIVKHIGGDHSAWDGYITGKTVELIEGKRIVQSWRTNRCGDDPPFDAQRRAFALKDRHAAEADP
jgi:hypothetical protein